MKSNTNHIVIPVYRCIGVWTYLDSAHCRSLPPTILRNLIIIGMRVSLCGTCGRRTDAFNNAAIGPNIKLIESTNCMVHTPENKKHPLNLQTHRRTTHQRISARK